MHAGTKTAWTCIAAAMICFAAAAMYAQTSQNAQDKKEPKPPPAVSPQPGDAKTPGQKTDDTGGIEQPPRVKKPGPGQEQGKKEEGAPGKPTDQTGERTGPGLDWKFFAIMIGGFAFLMFWTNRMKRKQESKQKEMQAGLKKGDEVRSMGGILGTVIEVREDEIVVKVDETNNTRLHFIRSAIQAAGPQAKTDKAEDKR